MDLRNGDGCLVGNLTPKFQLPSCHEIEQHKDNLKLTWKVLKYAIGEGGFLYFSN